MGSLRFSEYFWRRLLQPSVVHRAYQQVDSTLNTPIHFNFILLTVYLTMPLILRLCSVEGLLVNGELGRMWKEVFVA